ncbi:MAG: hypothetical protein ACT4OF_07295 [Caulobacteraceae bacterium]
MKLNAREAGRLLSVAAAMTCFVVAKGSVLSTIAEMVVLLLFGFGFLALGVRLLHLHEKWW